MNEVIKVNRPNNTSNIFSITTFTCDFSLDFLLTTCELCKASPHQSFILRWNEPSLIFIVEWQLLNLLNAMVNSQPKIGFNWVSVTFKSCKRIDLEKAKQIELVKSFSSFFLSGKSFLMCHQITVIPKNPNFAPFLLLIQRHRHSLSYLLIHCCVWYNVFTLQQR